MMLLAFFRPGRHIRDTNRRNLSIIPAVIERMYHQVIGAACEKLLDSKAFWLVESGEVNITVMPDIEQIIKQHVGEMGKVGITFALLLRVLVVCLYPVLYHLGLWQRKPNLFLLISQVILPFPCKPARVTNELKVKLGCTFRKLLIQCRKIGLQFVICPFLFTHIPSFASHSNMEAQ